jgi:hypothetical protein
MTSTANVRIHHGEPPADQEAEQQTRDVQYWQLGVIMSYSMAVRDMLRISGLFDPERVERVCGEQIGMIEEGYDALLSEVSQRSDSLSSDNSSTDTFFEQVKKPTARELRRWSYYFERERRQEAKSPQPTPTAWTVSEYKTQTKTKNLKQINLEEQRNDE